MYNCAYRIAFLHDSFDVLILHKMMCYFARTRGSRTTRTKKNRNGLLAHGAGLVFRHVTSFVPFSAVHTDIRQSKKLFFRKEDADYGPVWSSKHMHVFLFFYSDSGWLRVAAPHRTRVTNSTKMCRTSLVARYAAPPCVTRYTATYIASTVFELYAGFIPIFPLSLNMPFMNCLTKYAEICASIFWSRPNTMQTTSTDQVHCTRVAYIHVLEL